jgi:hypothetical protein
MRRLVARFLSHRYLSLRLRKIRHICFEAGAYGTIKQHRAHVRLADRGIPTSNRRRGNNRGMSPYLVEALMRMSR